MSVYKVIYNPSAGNGTGEREARKLSDILKGEKLEYIDATKNVDYNELFSKMDKEDNIIISGGDGTLNHFINDTKDIGYTNDVYYFATGTGNDFLLDIGGKKGEIINITKYLKGLPSVFVNGKEYKFINGVGYGIDGYCCEEGDKLRSLGEKINYTAIAIKGLLFHYKPKNAVVTVDGTEYSFKKAWLAPTMFGRFYGGGMMSAPEQNRLAEDKKVSCMVMFGAGKIKTLIVFSSIFKGGHVNHKDMCRVISGKEIEVRFDRPAAVQIDGETITGVSSYRVVF